MAFSKTNFVDNQTVIDAATLNAIQDELIRVAGLLGKDIQSAAINDSGHLILTLTDGTTLDAGVAKGAKGDAGGTGADGITPHIGDNGNWYIGSTDTGKPSKGEQGPGAEVFYIDLAGSYPNYTCPVAMTDIKAAYEAGKVLECRFAMGQYIATLPLFLPMPSANTWIFSGSGSVTEMGFDAQSLTIAIVNGTVQASDTRLASKDDIPKTLPNPNALTFTGAVTGTYNGSAPLIVKIPSAVTDDHINSLIDTKLGVIENGSY